MTRTSTRVLLREYPVGAPEIGDFQVDRKELPPLADNQFLIENLYLSLDAGFRQWMKEGGSDNYLQAMPLGVPVMSITLGSVIESRNANFPVGTMVMGRNAWETLSISDASDFAMPLEADVDFPLHYYVSVLGPTGLTAYFGLLDVALPKAGETILVSAAAGAVGVAVGQIAKLHGCRTVGVTSTAEKCAWLKKIVGYDEAISHQSPDLDADIKRVCPKGVDIYFDNVGGAVLDTALGNMNENGRVVLCGAMALYNADDPVPIFNMWEGVTKRLRLQGFMFSDYYDRYPEAYSQLQGWLRTGALKSFDTISDGIENTPAAFRGMMLGANRGKSLVRLK